MDSPERLSMRSESIVKLLVKRSMSMHRSFITSTLTVLLLFPIGVVGQTLDSAFTYQGQLKQSGAPFTGTADLECKLFTALTGGAQVGSTLPVSNLAVTNGLFTVSLN